MTRTVERGALVRRIATFAALGTFVIVVASAFLRLSAPHQDCADWPACYGKVTQRADGTEPSAARRFARLAHRIAATAVSASILALAVLSFTRRGGSGTDRVLAVALVALTGFLAVLGRWTPDVLVSDVGMPGEDGFSFIQSIRQREAGCGAALPAVAVTAYARPEDRERVLAAGFQVHLSKPIEPAGLLAVIRALAPGAPRSS